jgi:hypothetical protein
MAKSSNEAKLPVIIALVVFILATLGLGIFAYTQQEQITNAQEAEKKAIADDAASKKSLAGAREELLLYKAVVGNLTPEERQTVQSGLTDAVGFRDKHTKLMQDITGRVAAAKKNEVDRAPGIGGGGLNLADAIVYQWDWPANQQNPPLPRESIIDASVRNVAQRELAKRKSDAEIKVMQDSVKSLNDVIAQFNEAKAKLEQLNKQYPEDVKAEVSKAIAQFDGFKVQFQNVSGQYRKDTDKLTDDIVAREVSIKRAQADNERYKAAVDKLNEQLDAGVDPFQYDKPKGKVIRRYSENLVDVDIGSADNLRAGQTFSVFPSDTPTRGMQSRMRKARDLDGKEYARPVPKGTLEVVDILGANLAQCRITTEDSQVRDRILAGDLLYNAVWNKGASEHIVLFGIFDIDGDGRDDIQTIVKNLSKVGVAVDGYFDLAKMKWEGEITSQTTFAVEGYYPSVSIADGNRDGKIKILGALADAKRTAKDKGLRILRPRDFFPRIGYNAKLDITEEAINSAATYYLRVSGMDTAEQPATPAAPAAPGNNN